MKIAIIYYSHTGNTKTIAEYLGEHFSKVHQVVLQPIQSFKESLASYDALLLGCPALGDEGIDALYMEPFVEAVPMVGKPIALFGSYGWGNGEWMLEWSKRLKSHKKAKVYGDYLMIKGTVTEETKPYVDAYIADLEHWIERATK